MEENTTMQINAVLKVTTNEVQCGMFLVSRSGMVSRKSEGVCHLHMLRADCLLRRPVVITKHTKHAPEVAAYCRWHSMYFGHVIRLRKMHSALNWV